MKYTVKYTTAYKKAYKRCLRQKRDMELLNQVVGMLADGKKLPDRYRDHSLSGKLSLFRECHIQPDWRLVYRINNDVLTLTLITTGSHADIFNM